MAAYATTRSLPLLVYRFARVTGRVVLGTQAGSLILILKKDEMDLLACLERAFPILSSLTVALCCACTYSSVAGGVTPARFQVRFPCRNDHFLQFVSCSDAQTTTRF